MRTVVAILLTLAAATGLSGCGSDNQSASRTALEFALALRRGDTVSLKRLATSELLGEMLNGLPDTADLRLRFPIDRPRVIVKFATDSAADMFVWADSTERGILGVMVYVDRGPPHVVRGYQMMPDLWP